MTSLNLATFGVFDLSDAQKIKLNQWSEKIFIDGVNLQKKQWKDQHKAVEAHVQDCWDMGYPYTGAAGGQFTFMFTPTSIGVICKVRDAVTGEEVDLTDYDHW